MISVRTFVGPSYAKKIPPDASPKSLKLFRGLLCAHSYLTGLSRPSGAGKARAPILRQEVSGGKLSSSSQLGPNLMLHFGCPIKCIGQAHMESLRRLDPLRLNADAS
jgi:hypothetical protein